MIGFSADPVLLDVTYSSVSATIKLDNYGFVYGVAVPKDADLGKPRPFQIASGLNRYNFPQRANYTEVALKFTSYLLFIDGLLQQTEYHLYITAGSAHPGSPDLMDDSFTFMIEFTTLKAPRSKFISSALRY